MQQPLWSQRDLAGENVARKVDFWQLPIHMTHLAASAAVQLLLLYARPAAAAAAASALLRM
jgi:hypothetical protein